MLLKDIDADEPPAENNGGRVYPFNRDRDGDIWLRRACICGVKNANPDTGRCGYCEARHKQAIAARAAA